MQNIIIIIAILVTVFVAIKTGFVEMAAKFVIEILAKWTAKVVILILCLIVLGALSYLFTR